MEILAGIGTRSIRSTIESRGSPGVTLVLMPGLAGFSGGFTKWGFRVCALGMRGTDNWSDVLAMDTSEDVNVAEPSEGIYVFYTEGEEEYVRTDQVVDVRSWR